MTNLNNESSKESSPNSLPFTSISFACGGWLQFYLYGCARAIQAQGIDNPDLTYLGCSAGALAACGIVFEGKVFVSCFLSQKFN